MHISEHTAGATQVHTAGAQWRKVTQGQSRYRVATQCSGADLAGRDLQGRWDALCYQQRCTLLTPIYPNSIPILASAKLCQCKYFSWYFQHCQQQGVRKSFSTSSHPFVTRTFSITSLWNWWDWSQLAALTRMLFACFPSSSVWEPVVRVGGCTWAEARWSLFTNPATSNWGKRGVWATPTTRPRNPKCAVSVKLFVMLLFTRKTCL